MSQLIIPKPTRPQRFQNIGGVISLKSNMITFLAITINAVATTNLMCMTSLRI